jgi:transcriptional regulator with XRE-family HTH domain
MTLRHYQRIERGLPSNPTLASLLAVAKALKVLLETLIEESRAG